MAQQGKDIAEANAKALNRLIDRRGAEALHRLYVQAVQELEAKLARIAGADDTMTLAQKRMLLAQAKFGVITIQKRLTAALGEVSAEAQDSALNDVIDSIERLEKHFTGSTIVLPFAEASRFQGIIDKRRTSLLNAHQSSMQNYGEMTVRALEQTLAKSLMTGESTHEAVQRIVDVTGGEWWRAERIARTELAWAFNATHADGIKEAAKELPDMMMRWSEHVDDKTGMPMDDRVAVDSIAMHGQLAKPGGLFTMPGTAPKPDADGRTVVPPALVGKTWAFPPNRPNDRAVVSPWRYGWGIPGWIWEGGQRVPYEPKLAPRTVSVEPPAPPEPEPEPEPVKEPPIEPGKRPMTPAAVSPEAILKAPKPRHGVAVAADAEAIEGQNVQTRMVRDGDEEFYEFTFKLTQDAGERARKAIQAMPGAQKVSTEFQRMVQDTDGVLKVDKQRKAVQKVGSSDVVKLAEVGGASVELGSTGATANLVRVRVPVKGAPPPVAAEVLKAVPNSLMADVRVGDVIASDDFNGKVIEVKRADGRTMLKFEGNDYYVYPQDSEDVRIMRPTAPERPMKPVANPTMGSLRAGDVVEFAGGGPAKTVEKVTKRKDGLAQVKFVGDDRIHYPKADEVLAKAMRPVKPRVSKAAKAAKEAAEAMRSSVAVEAYEKTLQRLGIADPRALPDPRSVESLRKMQIISKFDTDALVQLNKGGALSSPQKVDAAFEEVLKKNPKAGKILADMERREVYFGHDAQFSKAQAEMFKEAGVHSMTHDSSADEKIVASMLTEDGLMSSSTRFQNGVFTEGMSTSTDFKTGGADGVFLRIQTSEKDALDSAGAFRFIIDTEELGRMDWWAFNHDNYGRAGMDSAGGRWKLPDMLDDVKGKHVRSGNEVMFKKGIPPSSIRGVVTRSEQLRKNLIAELSAKGVKEINGVPIDKFVRVDPAYAARP